MHFFKRIVNIIYYNSPIEHIQTTDIYDYSEDDAEKLINQLIRATHLLSVAARCLPTFKHMMLKKEKE